MVGMRPLGLRIRLRHIRTRLRLPVKICPIAVVDIARRIHPNQARPSPSSLGLRSRLRRRRSLRSRSRRCGCNRSRSRRRSSCGCRSSSRSCLSRGRRSSRRSRSRRIPFLHTLMTTACTLLAGRSRVGSILAKPGRSRRRRRLSYRNLRCQKPSYNCQQTNRSLHKVSYKNRILLIAVDPNTAESYAIHSGVSSNTGKQPAKHRPRPDWEEN
jgi:hypothetical protein